MRPVKIIAYQSYAQACIKSQFQNGGVLILTWVLDIIVIKVNIPYICRLLGVQDTYVFE